MKIIFLCGSLERGRDGVGDYTRRLAEELILQGNQAGVVALNDKYLDKAISFNEEADGVYMPVLRIPSTWSEKLRFRHAKKWIDAFDPDWISLQFVLYAYQSKGLPLFLAIHLRMLTGKRKVHIMFHETWIGARNYFEVKRLATSILQKLIINRIIKTLRPAIVHTHLPIFYYQLESIGYNVHYLPLFSNIKPFNNQLNYLENNILRIGFFSQVNSSEPIIKFLTNLSDYSRSKGMVFEVLLIGGAEARMRNVLNTLEKVQCLKGRVKYTGFLKTENLSEVIGSCFLGVTSVPRHALGKSGSVAAFLDHGVPVAAPKIHAGYDPSAIGFFSPKLSSAIITKFTFQEIYRAKKAVNAARKEIQLSTIAKVFVSDLEHSTKC